MAVIIKFTEIILQVLKITCFLLHDRRPSNVRDTGSKCFEILMHFYQTTGHLMFYFILDY